MLWSAISILHTAGVQYVTMSFHRGVFDSLAVPVPDGSAAMTCTTTPVTISVLQALDPYLLPEQNKDVEDGQMTASGLHDVSCPILGYNYGSTLTPCRL